MASTNRATRIIIIGFLAGAVSVLVFHQGFILIAHLMGVLPNAPYSLEPTAPLGVPRVISAAFWGGLWGIALAVLLGRVRSADRLWVAVLFGGLLLPLVAAFVVTPLKGGDMATWWNATTLLRAFIINGVWGLGAALLYRLGRALLP
jgi:hypothetical protein